MGVNCDVGPRNGLITIKVMKKVVLMMKELTFGSSAYDY